MDRIDVMICDREGSAGTSGLAYWPLARITADTVVSEPPLLRGEIYSRMTALYFYRGCLASTRVRKAATSSKARVRRAIRTHIRCDFMNTLRIAIFLPCLLIAMTAASGSALDVYNQALIDVEDSQHTPLLLYLTLDDCRSFLGTKGWDEVEAMIERAKLYGLDDFEAWEADVRERFGWCADLLAKFDTKADYEAQQARWLQQSVDSGSTLAEAIQYHNHEQVYAIQQHLQYQGREMDPLEASANVDVDDLVQKALLEAYAHGSARLKQAAIDQVFYKFRKDEAEALGASTYFTPTPQQEHELQVLRSGTDEIPWEYLSCKYLRGCTFARFAEYLGDTYTQREIENFVAIAEYYERCIEAGDWLSLGWDE